MKYEDLARIINMKQPLENLDEIQADGEDSLSIHADLGRRLAVFPRERWRALVYDVRMGLLFIYEPAPKRFLGVLYRDISVENACIMIEYAAVVDLRRRSNWTFRELSALTTQMTVTRIHDPYSYRVFHDSLISFPLPVKPQETEVIDY